MTERGNVTAGTQSQHQDGPFSVVFRALGRTTFVAVRGELDLATVPAAAAALRDAERSQPLLLVLDIAGVDFLDCAGVRVMLEAADRARRDGRHLVVVGARGVASRVLALTTSWDTLHVLAERAAGRGEVRRTRSAPAALAPDRGLPRTPVGVGS